MADDVAKAIRSHCEIRCAVEIAEVKDRSFDIKHTLTKDGKVCVEGTETRVWTVKDPERGIKSAPIPEELVARFKAGANP